MSANRNPPGVDSASTACSLRRVSVTQLLAKSVSQTGTELPPSCHQAATKLPPSLLQTASRLATARAWPLRSFLLYPQGTQRFPPAFSAHSLCHSAYSACSRLLRPDRQIRSISGSPIPGDSTWSGQEPRPDSEFGRLHGDTLLAHYSRRSTPDRDDSDGDDPPPPH